MSKIKQLFFLAISVMVCSCSSDEVETIDLSTGLKAYYTFSGNANDESGNGKNGVPSGDIKLSTDKEGNQNSAYDFDGIDDFIDTGSTFDFDKRTVSLWINPSSVIGAAGGSNNKLIHVAITQDDVDLDYGILRVGIDNGVMKLAAGGANGSYSSNISTNNWYHLVLIRDGSKTKYYINNTKVFEGDSDSVASSFNPNKNFIIGSGRSKTDQFFKGKIDNIRVYNIALTEEQISEIYNKYQ